MRRVHGRTDVLLAISAAIIVGVWLYISRSQPSVEEQSSQPFARFSETPPDLLEVIGRTERIAIIPSPSPNADTRYVVRGKGEPPADESSIDRLLHALATLEVVRDVAEPAALEALGLASPSLQLNLSLKGHTFGLTLGNPSPTPENSRYAQLTLGKNRRIVVLPIETVSRLDVTPESLVDHRLIDWVPSDIETVTISRNYREITLTQLETGRFELGFEPRKRAKRDVSERLLMALTELKVERYLDRTQANESMTKALVNVRLTSNQERPQVPLQLSFGGPCPKDPTSIVVTLTGTVTRVGCVLPKVLEVLPNSVEELEDLRLFFLRADEVEKLSVDAHEESFVLERQGTAFRLTDPTREDVTLDAGNALLNHLEALEGVPIGRCDKAQLSPERTIALRSGIVGKKSFFDERLRVGPRLPNGERQVCRDDNQRFLVTRKQVSSLMLDRGLLTSVHLLNEPYDSINTLTIVNSNGLQRFTRDAEGHLGLSEPNLPGDTASIQSLMERLAQLTAERWLLRSTADALRNVAITAKVTFHTEAESGTRSAHELRLFRDIEPFPIALLDDRPSPFVLAESTAELLDGLLVDRSMYRLTESDRAFSLSRRTDPIRCEKGPLGFQCPSLKGGPQALEHLVSTLSQLRAERVERGHRPTGTEAIVFNVYGDPAQKPRFTVELHAPAPSQHERYYTAFDKNRALLLRYRARELSVLETLFGVP